MDSIKSWPKENNGYNLEENWSSESKYKDANEDFENIKIIMPIELIIKKSLNNDDQKLILFQNSSKRILKLMNLTHNLPKQKENLEIFLSKRKIYRKKKIRE